MHSILFHATDRAKGLRVVFRSRVGREIRIQSLPDEVVVEEHGHNDDQCHLHGFPAEVILDRHLVPDLCLLWIQR